MSQKTLKEIKYNGSDVIVEVARRDALGNTINSTYATKTEVTTGLGGKEPSVTLGTGLERSSSGNTYNLKIASDTALGGIKVGSGLSITSAGVLSVGEAGSVAWANISSKPFASLSTDFSVASNVLSINGSVWASKNYVDTGFVSLTTYNTYIGTTAPATYHPKITSSSKLAYSLISGTPTKLSDFTNDSSFITAAVNNLTNYYLKSETYTKSEIEDLIAAVKQFQFETAAELPEAKASTMYKIYLIPSPNSATNNAKDEFITIDKGSGENPRYVWEQIGSTSIDLSNYVQADSTLTSNQILTGAGTKKAQASGKSIAASGSLSNDNATIPTSALVYAAVGAKQNTLTQASNGGNGITITDGVIASVITATDVTLDY